MEFDPRYPYELSPEEWEARLEAGWVVIPNARMRLGLQHETVDIWFRPTPMMAVADFFAAIQAALASGGDPKTLDMLLRPFNLSLREVIKSDTPDPVEKALAMASMGVRTPSDGGRGD